MLPVITTLEAVINLIQDFDIQNDITIAVTLKEATDTLLKVKKQMQTELIKQTGA